MKGFLGFGEKENNIKSQESQALQPTKITPISVQPIPQNQKTSQNVSVAFTGDINVQTTDGKIPENSQLQRDIQREVEVALKKSQESQRNRTMSDIDF